MRNPPAAFKHDDPTHRSYGQSADSALLAKRRQNFDRGGTVGEDLIASLDGSRQPYNPITGRAPGDLMESLDKTRKNYNPITGRTPDDKIEGISSGRAPYSAVTGRLQDAVNPVLPPGARNEPAPEGRHPKLKTGKGTARVDLEKHPGWPTM